ncbi:hypothetical protein [Streptomyces sp. NBC_01803]|uniref:hypothetical protein n=1 Tax=Streptomyces sp. NBC_01803 TaxID=2975946 RepID=UPI002DDBA00D|nr:hypothetical protein [Streptomyces sp. NBC_01803]WSA45109.1 hypothetical protein OIE51_13370 [Streptomyces sp. NBC_01803]
MALVRPYMLTPEERQQRRDAERAERLRRERRRTLWLATHGIDMGPRWIHGVEVLS